MSLVKVNRVENYRSKNIFTGVETLKTELGLEIYENILFEEVFSAVIK